MNQNMKRQINKVRKAYDLTVEEHNKRMNLWDKVPEEFKNSPELKTFIKNVHGKYNSNARGNKEYLDPEPGMHFLDVGCCANLSNYRLDKWPSTYYGVDISSALIKAMKNFVVRENISIGGLWIADLSKLPFENNFFDIAAVIGVLEYCTLDYVRKSLTELHRALKPHAKAIMDIPNQESPYYTTMIELEKYLGRPNIFNKRLKFEEMLAALFSIERIDDSNIMIKYFVKTTK